MRTTGVSMLLAGIMAIGLPIAPAAAQVKVTTSNGDVTTFSQKNLADHLIVVDSVGLETAQLAVSRTQNTAVRDFANMLLTDYRGELEKVRKTSSDHDVGRQASANDTAAAAGLRALANLRSMSGDSAFDQEFVREQLRSLGQEVVALKMLGGAAKDDDLKDDVKRALPMAERHLARARDVAAQLGMPTDVPSPKSP